MRPAICYPALADGSSLKREVVEGLDIMIVRELTGGTYFGEPKEMVTLQNGEKRAVDTQIYTTHEIERITRIAFDLARKRSNKVHSADKRNVMISGVLWNEVVTAVHSAEYSDVELHHILADNCAMQLVRWPKQFDVIVTDNLFGDILSDEASMLTGSLGMLPSASLGAEFAAEIHETHHIHKIDSPSGTALKLGETIAAARAQEFNEDTVRFEVERRGEVPGDHVVILASPTETLTLKHSVTTRAVFAAGALRAARWVVDQPPGLYGMRDVLKKTAA